MNKYKLKKDIMPDSVRTWYEACVNVACPSDLLIANALLTVMLIQ